MEHFLGTGMLMEHLKKQGTSNSSDVDQRGDGGQLVSTDLQAGRQDSVSAGSLPGLQSVKELTHILFADL